MTEPERSQLRLAHDDSPTALLAKINRLEERLEKLEHWRTFQIGLLSSFTFCGAFIGYLVKTYVFK